MKPMTRAEFLDEVLKAKHGQRIVYHEGFLLGDRRTGTSWETAHTGVITLTANAAFRAAEEGHVRLFQQKLGPCNYRYIAEKQIPAKPLVWEGCYDPNRSKNTKPPQKRVDRTVAWQPANPGPSDGTAVQHAA